MTEHAPEPRAVHLGSGAFSVPNREHEAPRVRQYKPYAAYKNSGVEWLGTIPASWKTVRVAEVATLLNGYPFDSEFFVRGDGIPLVRIRDLNGVETEVNYIGPVIQSAWIDHGDVIVGMDGDFNVARWRGQRALLNQRMCCLRPRKGFDAGFIAHLLPFPLGVINDLTYSTTVKHLSSADVRKIQFGSPGREEQRAIARFLDRETTKIDTLVAREERLIELLEEKRTALIIRAVTRGLDPSAAMKASGVQWLGEIPEHWEAIASRRLISRIEQGWSPVAEDRTAGLDEWAVIKLSAVHKGTFLPHEHKALPIDVEPDTRYEIHEGDFLLTRANTPDLVGDVCVAHRVRSKLMLCDLVYRLKFRDHRASPTFLAYWLLSPTGRHQIEVDARGASQSMVKVSQGHIRAWTLVLPPVEEQRAITMFLDRETARIDALIAKVRQAIDLLKELRTALISAAVTGKIDVRKETA
jgi:type I restriction enzyme S subunit